MRITKRATAIAAVCMAIWAAGSSARATGDKPGRYSMSPADGGGVIRLDTQTGSMSLCQRAAGGDWSCREMAEPGRGLSEEIDRLRAENQRLKAEIRQMEDIVLGDKRAEAARPQGPATGQGAGPGFNLPTEADVDQAMSYVQRMLRKLREKWKELETEGKGIPL